MTRVRIVIVCAVALAVAAAGVVSAHTRADEDAARPPAATSGPLGSGRPGSDGVGDPIEPSDKVFAQSEIRSFGGSTDYVALGDSFSVMDMSALNPNAACLRSANPWPRQLTLPGRSRTVAAEGSLVMEACAGATTDSVRSSQLGGVASGTDLVTITIGGNDVGFDQAWRTCLASWDCTTDPRASVAWIDKALPRVESLLAEIRARTTATVLLVGYPQMFGSAVSCFPTNAFTYQGISQPEWERARALNDRLNDMLASSAARAGVHFVDAEPAFVGHDLCAPNLTDRWIEQRDYFFTQVPPHPNAAGHAAYARLVKDWLSRAGGLPSNPAPQGGLSVTPVEGCRTTSTMRGYDKVRIMGSAFPASSPATLRLGRLSLGRLSASSAALPSSTTSADGRLDTTAFLPEAWSGTAGSIPSGATVLAVSAGGTIRNVVLQYDTGLPPCDESGPSASIVSPPDGLVVLLNAPVPVRFTCTDDRYPQGDCARAAGSAVSDGGLLPTGTPGPVSLVVTAHDLSRTVTATRSYQVRYRILGSSPPEGSSNRVWGNPMTVALQLGDHNGSPVTSPSSVTAATVRTPTGTTALTWTTERDGMVRVAVPYSGWTEGLVTVTLADGTVHSWTITSR